MPKRKLGHFRQEVDDGIRARQIRKIGRGHKVVTSAESFKPRTLTTPISLRDLPAIQRLVKGHCDEIGELVDRLAKLTLETQPLDLFTYFGLLPPELRIKIWTFARPDPRIVRLAWSQWEEEDGSQMIYSSAEIPNLLHTCFESRQIALKWYQLSFYWNHNKYPNSDRPRHTYFDFSSDYLSPGSQPCNEPSCKKCLELLYTDGLDDIKKVLVRWPYFDNSPLFHISLWYPGVEEVLLMDWSQGPLKSGTRVEELVEVEMPFEWQWGKSMEEALIEEKKRVFAIGIDSMVGFNPAKIARIENIKPMEMEEEL